MRSPAVPYNAAEEAALRASAELKSVMGLPIARLYVEVPANAPLPYVVHGQHQVLLEDLGCGVGAEVFSTVTLWSRPTTPDKGEQARAIGAAVLAALATELTVAGWKVDDVEVVSERYSTDPDQSIKGVIELRHLLSEQAA